MVGHYSLVRYTDLDDPPRSVSDLGIPEMANRKTNSAKLAKAHNPILTHV